MLEYSELEQVLLTASLLPWTSRAASTIHTPRDMLQLNHGSILYIQMLVMRMRYSTQIFSDVLHSLSVNSRKHRSVEGKALLRRLLIALQESASEETLSLCNLVINGQVLLPLIAASHAETVATYYDVQKTHKDASSSPQRSEFQE